MTKKQKSNGFSGNVNASYSTNNSYSTDLSINIKSKKSNIYIGADLKENINNQYFDFNRKYTLDDTIYQNNEVVDQTGKRPSSNLKIGFDYDFNPANIFSLAATTGTNNFNKDKAVYNEEWNTIINLPYYFANNEDYNVQGYFIKPALLYIHKFNEKENQISFDFAYTFINSDFEQLSKDFVSDNKYNSLTDEPDILKSQNSYKRYVYEAKADYTSWFGNKVKFESGLYHSANKREVTLNFKNFDYNVNNWLINADFSNELIFNQNIFAGYLLFSGQIFKTDYQIGLRSEYTSRKLDQVTGNEDYRYQKLDFFPTLHLSKQVSEKFQVMASYSRRIQRPTDMWLNPFPSSVSYRLLNIGNPDLKPELTDSYELNFGFIVENLTISVNNYYRNTHDAITQVSFLSENGGHKMTYGNIASNQLLGSEISLGITSINKVKIYPSVDLYYLSSEGDVGYYKAKFSTVSYALKMNSTIDIAKLTRFQIYAEYNGKSITQQGTLEPFYLLTASLKQELFQKRVSIVLQARNLFGSGRIKMDENGVNFYNKVDYQPQTNIFP